MIGGVAFPPALIVIAVVIGIYLIKKIVQAIARARRVTRKLSNWRHLIVGKAKKGQTAKAYANGCFVAKTNSTAGCPSEYNLE